MKKFLKVFLCIVTLSVLSLSACVGQISSESTEETKRTEKSAGKSEKTKRAKKSKKSKKKKNAKTKNKETETEPIVSDEIDWFAVGATMQYGDDESTKKIISYGRYDTSAAMAAGRWREHGLFDVLGLKEQYENAAQEAKDKFLEEIGGEDSDIYKVCMGGIDVWNMEPKELNNLAAKANEAYNEYINEGEDINFRAAFNTYIGRDQ